MDASTLIADLQVAGFTQQQIANELNCAQSSVNAWANKDRGEKRGIAGNYLLKLIALHKKHARRIKLAKAA